MMMTTTLLLLIVAAAAVVMVGHDANAFVPTAKTGKAGTYITGTKAELTGIIRRVKPGKVKSAVGKVLTPHDSVTYGSGAQEYVTWAPTTNAYHGSDALFHFFRPTRANMNIMNEAEYAQYDFTFGVWFSPDAYQSMGHTCMGSSAKPTTPGVSTYYLYQVHPKPGEQLKLRLIHGHHYAEVAKSMGVHKRALSDYNKIIGHYRDKGKYKAKDGVVYTGYKNARKHGERPAAADNVAEAAESVDNVFKYYMKEMDVSKKGKKRHNWKAERGMRIAGTASDQSGLFVHLLCDAFAKRHVCGWANPWDEDEYMICPHCLDKLVIVKVGKGTCPRAEFKFDTGHTFGGMEYNQVRLVRPDAADGHDNPNVHTNQMLVSGENDEKKGARVYKNVDEWLADAKYHQALPEDPNKMKKDGKKVLQGNK